MRDFEKAQLETRIHLDASSRTCAVVWSYLHEPCPSLAGHAGIATAVLYTVMEGPRTGNT